MAYAVLGNATTADQIASLDPRIQAFVAGLVSACRAAGWPVEIRRLGARRTLAEETRLWAAGATRLGNPQNSRHLPGLAFDLDLEGYPREAGMQLWQFLGGWWKRSGLRWGGDWGDYGHFEF